MEPTDKHGDTLASALGTCVVLIVSMAIMAAIAFEVDRIIEERRQSKSVRIEKDDWSPAIMHRDTGTIELRGEWWVEFDEPLYLGPCDTLGAVRVAEFYGTPNYCFCRMDGQMIVIGEDWRAKSLIPSPDVYPPSQGNKQWNPLTNMTCSSQR